MNKPLIPLYRHRPLITLPISSSARDAMILAGLRKARHEAIGICRELLSQPEPPVELHRLLGAYYFRQKLYEQAHACVHTACVIQPGYYHALCDVGLYSIQLKAFDEARDALLMAVSVDPGATLAWGRLSILYGDWKKREPLISVLRKIAEIDPANENNLNYLQQVLRGESF